jgi:peroxiredoxin (alkyl hydroperoxide reductase subunit C)
MTLVNTHIKPFKNQALRDGKFIEITEANLKGKWAVFFFYPADFTFVCPTELEDLADNYAEFQKLGVEIYSVSTDTHFSHKVWHETSHAIGKIKFTMVGDPTWQLARNFRVLRTEKCCPENDKEQTPHHHCCCGPHGCPEKSLGLADRGTFIVDPNGVIQAEEITAEGIGRNAAELLRKVKAAIYVATHPGEVCPAKWKEGEKTLAPSLDLVGKI